MQHFKANVNKSIQTIFCAKLRKKRAKRISKGVIRESPVKKRNTANVVQNLNLAEIYSLHNFYIKVYVIRRNIKFVSPYTLYFTLLYSI